MPEKSGFDKLLRTDPEAISTGDRSTHQIIIFISGREQIIGPIKLAPSPVP